MRQWGTDHGYGLNDQAEAKLIVVCPPYTRWQITPRILSAAIASSDRAAAKRAFEAMMTMSKIDIATIEAALKG